MSDSAKQTFLEAAKEWVCDGYSMDICYVAEFGEIGCSIWGLIVRLSPSNLPENQEFSIRAGKIIVGRFQRNGVPQEELLRILDQAASGIVEVSGIKLELKSERSKYFYSNNSYRNSMPNELHLRSTGDARQSLSSEEETGLETLLKKSSPPFDGFDDVVSHLGMDDLGINSRNPSIEISVFAPVDLDYENCSLRDEKLSVSIVAHPDFNVGKLTVAAIGGPEGDLSLRQQLSSGITWTLTSAGERHGVACVDFKNADYADVILIIGSITVRAELFSDQERSRNIRLLAARHFDKDLRMTRDAVFNSDDPKRFENGVSALLFLTGFSSAVQIEKDSPDLIVSTPKSSLILVECTTKISDFSAKLGKLVNRRGSLSKAMEKAGHTPKISAMLVCCLPKDQIAIKSEELKKHKVILITAEDLNDWFEDSQVINDPDKIIESREESFSRGHLGSLSHLLGSE